MNKDKIVALLMEALDYEMGPVPRSSISEALSLLNVGEATKAFYFTDKKTGVPWKAVIVPRGAYYGSFNEREGRRSVMNDGGPLVEFWDLRHKHDFEHKGQFVNRYFVSTLAQGPGEVLKLYGGEPRWTLCPATFNEVRQWLRGL